MANAKDFEYPKLRPVPGSEGLYYIILSSGSPDGRNPEEELMYYLKAKSGFKDTHADVLYPYYEDGELKYRKKEEDPNAKRRVIHMYKLHPNEDPSLTIEEAVKQNRAILVGNMEIEASKSGIENPFDEWGNMLLISARSGWGYEKDQGVMGISERTRGGDTLINRQGEVLVSPRKPNEGGRFIHPADHNGYYFVDVYKRNNPYMGKSEVVAKEFNFITPEGKWLSQSSFPRRKSGQLSLVRGLKPENKYLSGSFIVDSFYNESGHPEFFINVAELLITNREGARPILESEDEIRLLRQMFARKQKLPELINGLDNRYFDKTPGRKQMSVDEYEDLRAQLQDEIRTIVYFEENLMTKGEREFYTRELEDKLM